MAGDLPGTDLELGMKTTKENAHPSWPTTPDQVTEVLPSAYQPPHQRLTTAAAPNICFDLCLHPSLVRYQQIIRSKATMRSRWVPMRRKIENITINLAVYKARLVYIQPRKPGQRNKQTKKFNATFV